MYYLCFPNPKQIWGTEDGVLKEREREREIQKHVSKIRNQRNLCLTLNGLWLKQMCYTTRSSTSKV